MANSKYYIFLTHVSEGPNSNVLLEAQVPVVDTEQCEKSYRRVKNAVIDERVLCAGYAQGGKDACQVYPVPLRSNTVEHF